MPPRAKPGASPPPIASPDPRTLAGRVVLVTGGAQGIGRGIAQAVLGAGGTVAIGDLDGDAGRDCLKAWDVGARAVFTRVDVAREASVARWIQKLLRRLGRIDGLVNNAGIADPHGGPLATLPIECWQRVLATNLTGAMLCSKHAVPALRPVRGAIINIASTRAIQSEPDSEAYAASKGGLLALTHAMAVSLGPDVRVNAISPGWIETSAWQGPGRRRAPRLRAADHAQHPAGRVGSPLDIGALAVFLLSDAARFITGQNFIADGGMTRRMIYRP